jgi:type I restriction enzyme R subunit
MSPVTEEAEARETIDKPLTQAGWKLLDLNDANIMAGPEVVIREFPLPGHGLADYLLYVDGKAAGVIEAKKTGVTLSGVDSQSDKYTQRLPEGLPRWNNPLPFSYQSTGKETRFTNGLDPHPRARPVFAFHRPDTHASLDVARLEPSETRGIFAEPPLTTDFRTPFLPSSSTCCA